MTTTRFILARHGETLSSKQRLFAGATDVPLTDLGHEQAAALAARLRAVRIDQIFVSPLTRCQQTAAPILEATGRKPVLEDAIRECDFGAWENLSVEKVLEGWADHFQSWVGDDTLPPPNGESWTQLGERVVGWWDAAAERYAGRTVLAVTHGGPIMWLMRHLAELPRQSMAHFMIEPASVNVVLLSEGRVRVRLWNDTSHYHDPLMHPTELPPRGPVTATRTD